MSRPEGGRDAHRGDDPTASPARAAPSPEGTAPTFAEPWQAQAFALVESLRERGLIDGAEWTGALAEALDDQDPDRAGEDYHDCWLAALERLLVERGVVGVAELRETAAAWERAAHATPHGQPIRLENDPAPGRGTAPRR